MPLTSIVSYSNLVYVTIEVVDKLWRSGRNESLPEKGTRLCPCTVVAADFLELEVEAKFGTKIGSFKLLFGTVHCICLTFSTKWEIENWKTLIISFFQKNLILGKKDDFWARVIFLDWKQSFWTFFQNCNKPFWNFAQSCPHVAQWSKYPRIKDHITVDSSSNLLKCHVCAPISPIPQIKCISSPTVKCETVKTNIKKRTCCNIYL